MRKSIYVVSSVLVMAALFALAGAPQAQAPATAPVTTVVTVLGPKFTAPPAISKDDIGVYEGKDKKEVAGWTPAQGEKAGLQLAIVIGQSIERPQGVHQRPAENYRRGRILCEQRRSAAGFTVHYRSRSGGQDFALASRKFWRLFQHISFYHELDQRMAGNPGRAPRNSADRGWN
jgi:hypothetical protein